MTKSRTQAQSTNKNGKATTGERRRTASSAKAQPNSRHKTAREEEPVKRVNPNEGRGTLLAFACGIVLILHFTGDSNGALKGLHTFAQGMMGNLTLLLPALLFWMCIRAYRAARRQNEGIGWMLLPLAVLFTILTAVQSFFVKKVLASVGIRGFANFIRQAYKMCEGGGVLGSLLAYPLKFLTPWGTLFVLLATWFVALQFSGVISLSAMSDALTKGKESAARKFEEHKEKKRIRNEQKQKEHEQLFQEDIDNSNESGRRIRLPKLHIGSQSRVTEIANPGDEYTVPDVTRDSAPSKRRDTSAKTNAPKRKTTDEGVGHTGGKSRSIIHDVEDEDMTTRSERFMRSADMERARNARASAPKHAAPDISGAATEDGGVSETERTQRKPETAADMPKKQPQQPKPSFFDEEENSPIKQNSEQGRPTRGTYVPPAWAHRDESEEKTSGGTKPSTAARESESASKGPDKQAKEKTAPSESRSDDSETEEPTEHQYRYPPLDLMEAGTGSFAVTRFEEGDRKKAEILLQTLENFHIPVNLTGVSHGPAVTRFEIRPEPGIKVSKIASYADDIAMALSAESVRIEAPIPGKNAVGVEVPNEKKELVHLRDILQSDEVRRSTKRLTVGLGKDNSGRFVVADLAKMPHVLIAGQTGSGKSVCINALIISILYRCSPDEVRMILIDPKMVELNVYNAIPHLLVPVVIDPRKAAGALEWAVGEMDRRYTVFKEVGANNIESYNARLQQGEKPLPQIVIVVDELADLMMTAPKDVENAINRLAQLARAAGMHLVIATQRPSVDVVTGLIKANIPTRIAFTVASGVDSRTILDINGAEKLLGNGDMLYLPPNKNKPIRIQGAWVSEEEVQQVVAYISGGEEQTFDEDMLEHMESAALSDAAKHDKKEEQENNDIDDLFEAAVRCVVEAGQASISMLQRKLRVGYARAGRLIDEMAQRGYVSASEGSKSREVLLTREQLEYIFKKDND